MCTGPVFTPQNPRANHSNFLTKGHSFALKGRVFQKPKMRSELTATSKKFILREVEFSNNKALMGEFMEKEQNGSSKGHQSVAFCLSVPLLIQGCKCENQWNGEPVFP